MNTWNGRLKKIESFCWKMTDNHSWSWENEMVLKWMIKCIRQKNELEKKMEEENSGRRVNMSKCLWYLFIISVLRQNRIKPIIWFIVHIYSVFRLKKDKKMYKIRSLPSKKLVRMHIHVLFHLVNSHWLCLGTREHKYK